MHRAEHAGERAGTDQVQHLVVAVEEPRPLSAMELLQLIIGHQSTPEQQLRQLVEAGGGCAQLAPGRLQLALVDDPCVERFRGKLFGGLQFRHGAAS